MPSLTKIIKAAADRMKDVAVYLDRDMGCVTISAVDQEDIYMQGDEGVEFIAEVDKLWRKSGRVTEDEAARCHAEQYCENIWN